MISCRKLFAPIFLALVIGAPVCAGEMNAPPAPRPTPTSYSIKTSGKTVADSNCSGAVSSPAADVDAASAVINLLVSMLSIY
jgi:hypothetical protein